MRMEIDSDACLAITPSQALLEMVLQSTGPGGGATEAGSPAKIALFSLGNLAAYPQCAAELASLGIWQVLASLAAFKDPTIEKYCGRIHVGTFPLPFLLLPPGADLFLKGIEYASGTKL